MRINAINCGHRGAAHHQAKQAEIIINRRIPPGHDPKAAVKELQAEVDAFNRDYPGHDIPAVLFEFGILNLHHAINERIAPEDVIQTTKVYAVALMELLGVA